MGAVHSSSCLGNSPSVAAAAAAGDTAGAAAGARGQLQAPTSQLPPGLQQAAGACPTAEEKQQQQQQQHQEPSQQPVAAAAAAAAAGRVPPKRRVRDPVLAEAAAAGEGGAELDSQQTASGRSLRKVSAVAAAVLCCAVLGCCCCGSKVAGVAHSTPCAQVLAAQNPTKVTSLFALCHVLCVLCVQRPKVQPPASQAAAARAAAAASLALSVVGKRVEVWWQDDQRYYAGRITHYNAGTQQYNLLAGLMYCCYAAVLLSLSLLWVHPSTCTGVNRTHSASRCSACVVRCAVCRLILVPLLPQPLASTLCSMMMVRWSQALIWTGRSGGWRQTAHKAGSSSSNSSSSR
jgi:hypothetical protein